MTVAAKGRSMIVALKDIHPNPYRDPKRFPMIREKIETLKKSIALTTFWDNVVARKAPDGDGYQLGYGAHRLAALNELYPSTHKIDLIVRDLDNDMMLKMMANENLSEWGASALVEQESIRAVVLAYASGEIALPKPDQKTKHSELRYAPSFLCAKTQLPSVVAGHNRYPYTADSIGRFLGWTLKDGHAQQRVHFALDALEEIEVGLVDHTDMAGLTRYQSQPVIRAARATYDHHIEIAKAKAHGDETPEQIAARNQHAARAAKKAALEVKKQIQSGEVGYKEAGRIASAIHHSTNGKARKAGKIDRIDTVAGRYLERLSRYFDAEYDVAVIQAGRELWLAREDISPQTRRAIINAWRRIERIAAKFADNWEDAQIKIAGR